MTTQNSNHPTNLPTNSSTNPLTAAQSQLRSYLHKRLHALATEENGMSTVEYALGTIAAAAFGALLLSLIHISEPTRLSLVSRMPSSA